MANCIVLNKKDDGDFYGFEFVVKVLTKSKIEKRPHMLNIFIDDGRVVATDGRRLHCFDYHGKYLQGYYKVEAKTKTKLVLVKTGDKKAFDYPDYKSLFLKKGRTVKADKLYEHSFYKSIYKNVIGDRTININYLKDLPDARYDVVFVEENDNFDMAIFSNEDINSIIMAMYI